MNSVKSFFERMGLFLAIIMSGLGSVLAADFEYIIAWGTQWGWSSAIQVPGDYDGDGVSDLAVYDISTGDWFIMSAQNKIITWKNQWGWNGAKPVPGDYDGDGISDLAVVDPVSGKWYIKSLASSNSAQNKVFSIVPSEVTVTFIGQTIAFRTSNGTPPYTWSLPYPDSGSISPSEGTHTLYWQIKNTPCNIIARDAEGRIAVATIKVSIPQMTVSPSTATLENDGDLVSLTVSNGTPPYSWTVSDAFIGQMLNPPADSHNEVYQRLRHGDNSIAIEDSLGNTAIVIIKQPL